MSPRERFEGTPTVLIVDDEPGLVELFSAYLEGACETKTATTGREALDLVDDSIDVALVDRRMPEMTGDEALEELRTAGYRFPVAMVSAVQPDIDIIDMPFDGYLTKPVSRDALLDLVEILVCRQEYDEQSREFFRLAAKKRSLEANPQVETGPDTEYSRLARRMDELQSELNETLEELLENDPAHTTVLD